MTPRIGRQAGHRHHQHLERDQSLPRASARARRQRQARRAAGRRLPDRTAGDVARRNLRQADHHALSQHAGDGDRGAAAQPSDRRRRADGRLRQDHARADHGRHQHGHPCDLRAGRPHAARQLAGRISRLRLRRVEILDREARRQHHRRGMERDRGRHRPLVRHLHGDGHGGDHDGDRRSARPVAAGRLVDPGRRQQSPAHVRHRRPPHRRYGVGGSDAAENSDARRLRQRHQGAHGDGRLDQRHHPCGGHGAPRRPADGHGEVRPALAPGAGARQCAAVRQIPDGGFLLRRRLARADAEPAREARSHLHHRHRQDRRREHRRRQGASARRHPLAQRSGLCRGRHRRAQGQPRAQRLRHQAGRRRQALPQAPRQGHRLRGLQPHDARDRARRSRRHARPYSGAEERRARRAAPACRNGACCRSRNGCWGRACAT